MLFDTNSIMACLSVLHKSQTFAITFLNRSNALSIISC